MSDNSEQMMSYNTPDGKPPDHRQLLIDLVASAHGPQAALVTESALKQQDKQIQEAMNTHGKTADEVIKSQGVDLNDLINRQQKKGNFWHTPFQMNQDTGEVTPESILGGLFSNTDANTLKQVEASTKAKSSQGFNTEESISKMANLNKIIDQQLPGYQVTQTSDGNMIVHPKAAGVLSQMSPEQVNSLSDNLVNNQIAPSQLPRIQKAQVIAAALEKNPNYSPAQADMEFAANKMGAGAFEKNFNNLDSFHRDFEKNSDYLLTLSANMDRSKIPLLNKAIMAGARTITGDPKATQILQAVNTVGNGYARLQNPTLGGQALSDAARKESSDLVNGAQTDEQLRSLLDPKTGSMRIDANNRIQAAQEIRDRLSSTYGKNKEKKQSSGYSSYLKAIGR